MRRVVKTIYQKQVAIPDCECTALLRKEQPLTIVVPNIGSMTLKSREILSQRARIGDELFQDRFGGGGYKLWYYDWLPDAKQTALV